MVRFEALKNTRDVGGRVTGDGCLIRTELLYRSGRLYYATDGDMAWIRENIGTVVDFRGVEEQSEKPNPTVGEPGIVNELLPVFTDTAFGISREERMLRRITEDDYFRSILQSADTARDHMLTMYSRFITDPHACSQYARFIDILLRPAEKALLYNCSAGKDRTGFATAILYRLFGVDPDTIFSDYMETNQKASEDTERMIRIIMAGDDLETHRDALNVFFYAREEYLDRAFSEAKRLHGSFRNYLRDAIGIDSDKELRLRRLLLTE